MGTPRQRRPRSARRSGPSSRPSTVSPEPIQAVSRRAAAPRPPEGGSTRFAPDVLAGIRARAAFGDFAAGYPFPFDDFQVAAIATLLEGRGVLVAAPTGSGKTVVGECAAWLAVRDGRKCFYTTPIKALSNQKYHDLCARHGENRVGLLTGDLSINADASIVVMTTEVLRNMIYAGSDLLDGLAWVVMDEVHYLADRFRGAVWEEVILGLGAGVRLVCLSATVSNAEQFGAWLDAVRPGGMAVIVSEDRPVPLFQHVMVGRDLLPLYDQGGSGVSPALMRYAANQADAARARGPRRYGRGGGGAPGEAAAERLRALTPSRTAVVRTLAAADLLPAIVFIFSRAGCDGAVRQLLGAGVSLTDAEERAELLAIAGRHGAGLSDADRRAIGWDTFTQALGAGLAAHHAGLLPVSKAVVEEGFTRGLLKVVFATETLALGINMPARTVVIEKLVKFNGEATLELTPAEYTQLTGRAGRRGLDVEGHAVVTWNRAMNPKMVAGLASRRTYPLRSSFAPSYNMAVNLVATIGRARARALLLDSFAQYLADQASRHRGRTPTIAEQFDRVVAVLEELGYLTPGSDTPTADGALLARVYNELDLVLAEAIRHGTLAGLTTPQLAAVLSCLVYESRGDRTRTRLPDARVRDAARALEAAARDIALVERRHRVPPGADLDTGFAQPVYWWAQGAGLGEVLELSGLAGGDFVRWVRQVIDLAGQVATAPGAGPLRAACRDVIAALRRNIVDLDAPDAD